MKAERPLWEEECPWYGFPFKAPLFTHWFGIFAYDMYKSAEGKGANEDAEVKLVNGEVCVISFQELEKIVSKIQQLAEKPQFWNSSFIVAHVSDEKEGAPSQFAQALDNFLFLDGANANLKKCRFGTVHQISSGRSAVLVAELNMHCISPDICGGITNIGKQALLLEFEVNKKTVSLNIFISQPEPKVQLMIQICSLPLMSDRLKDIMVTLYGCVHSLLICPIDDPDCLTGKCCDGPHSVLNDWRAATVIHCKRRDMVVKFYDTLLDNPPVEAAWKAVGLPRVSLRSLNDRVQILEYEYLHGSHSPSSIKQFAPIIRKLHNLHLLGYVHGDIRVHNLHR